MTRTPVYFVSHGGPNTMYDREHPVWLQLENIGREITQKVKPRAIVVFSAHWQAEKPGTIEVNVAESHPLLYDYYGFPKSYYAEKFPNRGSVQVADKVIECLTGAGIETVREERGLDHGVFVPFKIMFGDDNKLTVPVVQVSLFDDDKDAEAHIKLGRAVEKLRDDDICVVASGMAVHNIPDFMRQGGRKGIDPLPYAASFDVALKEAIETSPSDDRNAAMADLLRRPDARKAHPTFEHLLPAHVGVGAAGQDPGKQLWTLTEGSMSWAQYRWGEVA